MKRFVYNEKYAKLLVTMDGRKLHIDELAREINANSGHLRTVLEQWHKEGIISKNQPGREYEISLTKKGSLIALKLAEMMQLVDHYKEKEVVNPENAPGIPKNANVTKNIGKRNPPNQGMDSSKPITPPIPEEPKVTGTQKKSNEEKENEPKSK